MDFKPSKVWQTTSRALSEVMDLTYKAHKDAEPKRKYLGGSMIGRDCEREIAYQYHGAPLEPREDGIVGFSGQLYRIFDRGHKGEDRVAEYLRIAGFYLVTHRKDGGQFGWSVLGGRMKGHIDGVILSGPPMPPIPGVDYAKPGLWENKILNHSTFGKLWNHGLKKTKPVYYVQTMLYCAYMELEWCLFTAENADNCEIYCEILPFDAVTAQEMSDRGVRIVQSERPEDLPRCTSDKTDFRCRNCDFKIRCWSEKESKGSNPSEIPLWLVGSNTRG